MADSIISIVHNLQYNLDGSGLQQATATISRQSQALNVQQQQLERLQRIYQQTNASDSAARTRIIALIDRQKTAIQNTTQAIGIEIAQNRRLQQVIQQEVGLINGLIAKQEALTKARNASTDVARIRAYNAELAKTNAQMQAFMGGTTVAGKAQTIGRGFLMGTGLVSGLGAIGIGLAVGAKLKGFIDDSSRLAAEMEGVQRGFNRLNDPNLLNNLREATKGTVSDLELMKSAVNFRNFGLPIDKLATALSFARVRAAETGQTVDYLVNSIVIGIGRQSPLILDNLGINARRVREEFARVGDFAQAAFNIINEEAAKSGDALTTYAERVAKTAAKIENLQAGFGQRVNDFKSVAGSFFGGIIAGDFSGAEEARLETGRLIEERRKLEREQPEVAKQGQEQYLVNYANFAKRYAEADFEMRSVIRENAKNLNEYLLQGVRSTFSGQTEAMQLNLRIMSAAYQRFVEEAKSSQIRLNSLNPDRFNELGKEQLELVLEKVGNERNVLKNSQDQKGIERLNKLRDAAQKNLDEINGKKDAQDKKDANKARQLAEQRAQLEDNLQQRITELRNNAEIKRVEQERDSVEKIDDLNALALANLDSRLLKEVEAARKKGLLTEKIASQFDLIRELQEKAAFEKRLEETRKFLQAQMRIFADASLELDKAELGNLNAASVLSGGGDLGQMQRRAQLETVIAVQEAERKYEKLADQVYGNAELETRVAKEREDEIVLIREQGNHKTLGNYAKFLEGIQKLNQQALAAENLNGNRQGSIDELQSDLSNGRITYRQFLRRREQIAREERLAAISRRQLQLRDEIGRSQEAEEQTINDPNATQGNIDDARAKTAELRREFSDLSEEVSSISKQSRDIQIANIQEIISAYQNLANEIGAALNQIYASQQRAAENEIRIRERRVEQATELARRGNTEILREEERRLAEAEKKRTEFARKQAAVNAILTVSNSVLAIAQAAGQTGAGAIAVVPAVIAALAAGFAAVSSLSNETSGQASFAEGGYTGDGGKHERAGTVHKGEFVMTAEKTKRYRTTLEKMHRGEAVTVASGSDSFASKGELRALGRKMDNMTRAVEGIYIKAENRLDANGVTQVVQSSQNIERTRFRG